MSIPAGVEDPVIEQFVEELAALAEAGQHAWLMDGITERVRLARMRLLVSDGRSKMMELKKYCQSTCGWIEEDGE